MEYAETSEKKKRLQPKELFRGIFTFSQNPDSLGGISYLVTGNAQVFMIDVPDLTFFESLRIADAVILHTPGHSPGSSTLYYPPRRSTFTGDHVTADHGKPVAEDFYWTYDYELQLNSARTLLDYDFDYILPAHGGRWLIKNAKHELNEFLKGHG